MTFQLCYQSDDLTKPSNNWSPYSTVNLETCVLLCDLGTLDVWMMTPLTIEKSNHDHLQAWPAVGGKVADQRLSRPLWFCPTPPPLFESDPVKTKCCVITIFHVIFWSALSFIIFKLDCDWVWLLWFCPTPLIFELHPVKMSCHVIIVFHTLSINSL